MFLFLSKTLDAAFDPLTWLWAGAAVAALLWWRGRRRAAVACAATPLGLLALFSSGPVAHRLAEALERGAPSSYRADVTYDAVILLGGTVDFDGLAPGAPTSFGDNVERLHVVFDLLRDGKARQAVVSGGREQDDGPTEAHLVVEQLAAWGIARDRLIEEPEARNTRENAVLSKKVVEARGFKTVLMVTSAFHMVRAAECFRAVDLAVDTLPVDFRMRSAARKRDVGLRSEHLWLSAWALREAAGRVVYRVRGFSR